MRKSVQRQGRKAQRTRTAEVLDAVRREALARPARTRPVLRDTLQHSDPAAYVLRQRIVLALIIRTAGWLTRPDVQKRESDRCAFRAAQRLTVTGSVTGRTCEALQTDGTIPVSGEGGTRINPHTGLPYGMYRQGQTDPENGSRIDPFGKVYRAHNRAVREALDTGAVSKVLDSIAPIRSKVP